MSLVENIDCLCQRNSNNGKTLELLRGIVFLLKLCTSKPILYGKFGYDNDEFEHRKEIWRDIVIEFSIFNTSIPRKCERNQCELIGLMQKTRKYFRIIAGKENVHMDDEFKEKFLSDFEYASEDIDDGMTVIGELLEFISLHQILYDPEHKDFENNNENLAVWNHICCLACDENNSYDFEFNVRFAERMLQRIVKPIVYKKDSSPAASFQTGDIHCLGTINITVNGNAHLGFDSNSKTGYTINGENISSSSFFSIQTESDIPSATSK